MPLCASNAASRRRRPSPIVPLGTTVFAIALAAGCSTHGPVKTGATPLLPASAPEASEAQVEQMCGPCHEVPRPSDFPKKIWRFEVDQAYGFFKESQTDTDGHLPHMDFAAPPHDAVLAYYEHRAPDSIPVIANTRPIGGCPVAFTKSTFELPGGDDPAISTVTLAHLTSATKLDVLACQIYPNDGVYLLRPYLPGATFTKIAQVQTPAKATVVDLDGDGVPDILVAALGSFNPSNARVGGVIWLRGHRDAGGNLSFTPYPLLTNVGRIADVEPVDVGGGRKDLIVAEFGHHTVGSIIYLENQTTDWSHPKFVPHVIDGRTGPIHVPVCNLSGHNRDMIAVISQEHEQVVAFINHGRGQYEAKTIFQGPHPALGSSGITLWDPTHSGRTSVLYTAGDLFDPNSFLRTDQGIYDLENDGTYPFKSHQIAQMYGCYRAIPADFQGNGKMDIVAVSNIPPKVEPNAAALHLDSMIYLQALPGGKYKEYSLEQGSCIHFNCAVGDIYGDGHQDVVVGNTTYPGTMATKQAITIWRNMGKAH